MTEYSAGLTSKLFWLQEARKTAALIVEGKIHEAHVDYRTADVLK